MNVRCHSQGGAIIIFSGQSLRLMRPPCLRLSASAALDIPDAAGYIVVNPRAFMQCPERHCQSAQLLQVLKPALS